ncbi:MAG: hypothetical protein ACLFR2_09805 [Candidatus Kapaibacterium sp.]
MANLITAVPEVEAKSEEKKFTQRLDFYWQSLSAYAVILIVYALFKGTISDGTVNIVLADPIVILLAFFVLISAISLLFQVSKNREIITGEDYIIFKSRLGQKKYTIDDIQKISLGREKLFQIRGAYKVIKIKLKDRKRTLWIRPSSFWDEQELVNEIARFKRLIQQTAEGR